MHPRAPTQQPTRPAAESEGACSSTLGGPSAAPEACTGVLPTHPEGRAEGGGEGRGGRACGEVTSEGRTLGETGRDGLGFSGIRSEVRTLDEILSEQRACLEPPSDGRSVRGSGSEGRAIDALLSDERAYGDVVSEGRTFEGVGSGVRDFGEVMSDKFGASGGAAASSLLQPRDSSVTLLPDPIRLPHHKLVQLL